MNRHGNIWEYFISLTNRKNSLRKAIKGKRSNPKIMALAENPDILTDVEQLIEQDKLPKHRYRKKVIYEGKKRNIYVIDFYPWRIVHHMFIGAVEKIFEDRFIFHTYGCIRGRGQHKGSAQCQKFANRYKYTLKCDIHKFYPSIKPEILYKLFTRVIKDDKINKIAEIIIFSHNKGIPIGNLPSQLFGNIYLNAFDSYVKHELKFKNYIRYVDDFLFCSDDKEELKEIQKKIQPWLKENLGLTLSKNQLFQTKQGIDFLGYRHFPGYRLLRKRTAYRVKKHIKNLEKAYDSKHKNIEQCVATISSFLGWIKGCNSYHLFQSLQADKIRKIITLKDFKKNRTTFISGKRVKIKDVPSKIFVNAFKITQRKINGKLRTVLLVQYYTETNNAFYFQTCSSTLIKQFEQVKEVPFSVTLQRDKEVLYAK